MSQFRPRSIARFTPRFRRCGNASVSIRLRMVCAFHGNSDARRVLRPLMQSAVTAALALFAGSCPVFAQTITVPHDVTVRFQTSDVANPGGGALQSMWAATDKAGWTKNYNLATSWNVDKSFGSYKRLKTPDVKIGLLKIPGIDFGEFGAGGRVFTSGKDTGLHFSATATGGNVSVDYPVHLHMVADKYCNPGSTLTVHVTYEGDASAKVSTLSPTAKATVSLSMDAQLYLNMRVEAFSRDIFNGDIMDFCKRDDPASPKYNAGGGNKGIGFNQVLFDSDALFNSVLSKYTTYEYPGQGKPPSILAEFNKPVIQTLGQPGSSATYKSGAGGTSSNNHSYEYTTGITIPSEVSSNPNATYARGQDKFINVTADFTNIFTNALESAGIPFPPLNYEKDFGPLSLAAGMLDLKADVGIGFLQEFGFVPKPKVRLQYGSDGATTDEYEVDPVNGVDIPVPMPQSTDDVSVKVVPIVTMGNKFISNTYVNFSGGMSFRPVYLEASSSAGGSFTFEPFNAQVGADVPVSIYNTTFEIPFDAQVGDAFYVRTQKPPLASLQKVDHSLLYINENRKHGEEVGFNTTHMILTADPTIVDPTKDDFAGRWFGTLGKDTQTLTYSTQAFWDALTDDGTTILHADDPKTIGTSNLSDFQASWSLIYENGYNNKPQKVADSTAGIHHIYTKNTAKTPKSNFGPLITSLPVAVAYPKPYLDMLAVRCQSTDSGARQEYTGAHGLVYKPFDQSASQGTAKCGPIMAGTEGFTMIAIDHQAFNDPDAPNDPLMPRMNGAGSYSRIKFDGKLLSPDTALVYNNYDSRGASAYPFTTGMIPASMLAQAGNHTICISNPTTGGKGGDSNVFLLQVVNPVPSVDDTCAVYKNPVKGADVINTDLYSHDITAGSPDTRVRITGSNLLKDTMVYWQGGNPPLATEFVNSHLIYAILPAAYIAQPQKDHTLKVVNPNSGTTAQPDGGTNITYKLNINTAKPAISGTTVDDVDINALTSGTPQDVALTLKGDHFWPGVTAWWNDQSLTMIFVDEHTLHVTVPASLLTRADTVNLAIRSVDFNAHTEMSAPYKMRVVYAAPVLMSLDGQTPALSPAQVQVNTRDNNIALTGGLFYTGSKVKVNGMEVKTTFVDSTHLTAAIPPELLSAPGSYDVVVVNPSSPSPSGIQDDGGASKALQFVVQGSAQVGMTATLTRVNDNYVEAQITLTDNTLPSMTNASVQSAMLGSNRTGVSLPYSLGTLKIGDSKTLKMQFACPVDQKGKSVSLVLTLGAMEGRFGCSTVVTLP